MDDFDDKEHVKNQFSGNVKIIFKNRQFTNIIYITQRRPAFSITKMLIYVFSH